MRLIICKTNKKKHGGCSHCKGNLIFEQFKPAHTPMSNNYQDELNEAQQAAVVNTEGPAMV
ncbi:MAG: hypothetical protein MUP53_06310, partial [Bacteroidales bacterium]|nr:hypothetical protein [Bacteroidales bacterium]